ncbi:MAG: sulfite:cytochrome C oxidoreductase subunit B [Sulfurimonas sp.]
MKQLKLIITFFVVFSYVPLFAQVEGDIKVPYVNFQMKAGKGVYSTRGKCNMCHSFGYILNQGKQSRKFWLDKTVKMIEVFKAPIKGEDIEIVVDYLYENYGNGELE